MLVGDWFESAETADELIYKKHQLRRSHAGCYARRGSLRKRANTRIKSFHYHSISKVVWGYVSKETTAMKQVGGSSVIRLRFKRSVGRMGWGFQTPIVFLPAWRNGRRNRMVRWWNGIHVGLKNQCRKA